MLVAEALPDSKGGTRPAGFRCLLAWAGDSSAITVDMASGKLGPCSVNHVPDNPQEASNLSLMAGVGKVMLKGRKGAKEKDSGKKKKSKGDDALSPTGSEKKKKKKKKKSTD